MHGPALPVPVFVSLHFVEAGVLANGHAYAFSLYHGKHRKMILSVFICGQHSFLASPAGPRHKEYWLQMNTDEHG
jgi:hypothetical protein